MAPEKFDFGEVLAVLEAKRAALDALIGSFRTALSVGALGDVDLSGVVPMPSLGGKTDSVDLPQGALRGMSIPAAIKLYLSAARRKQTTREVTSGLKAGGVESTSRHFENTVTTALHRLKAAGDVLRFLDGWALAEFYPENLRARIRGKESGSTNGKQTKKRRRKPRIKLIAGPENRQEAV